MARVAKIFNVVRFIPHIVHCAIAKKKIAMSFDVTDFCNLKCPYCYWWESRRGQELELQKIVKLAKMYRKIGVIHVTWVGGEPMLRPDVLRAVTPIFPMNWIVTNGTDAGRVKDPDFDPFSLSNTAIIVSLDGVGDAHDKSRNKPGLYEAIKKRFWDKPILTTTTLHQGNKDQPAKLLAEWSTSKITAMTFEFATPIGRAANPAWDIVGEDRDKLIDELITLKKKYGRFVANSRYGFEMQRSKNLAAWVGEARCPTATYVVCLDAMGNVKRPCVLGSSPNNPKGKLPNCATCGCHVPTYLAGLKHLDLESIDAVFWFLRS